MNPESLNFKRKSVKINFPRRVGVAHRPTPLRRRGWDRWATPTLREIVLLLERDGDLLEFLATKVRAAKLNRMAFKEIAG